MVDQAKIGRDLDAVAQTLNARSQSWDECGIEEKVERLRREVQNLRWGLNDMRRRTAHFEQHEHNAKGEVVVPLRERGGQGEASGRDMLA